MKTITYLKQTITKNEGTAGYALPYSVYMNGRFFYADSLSGIKQIIWKETPFRFVHWPKFTSKNKVSPCGDYIYIEGNGNRWKWHKMDENGTFRSEGVRIKTSKS